MQPVFDDRLVKEAPGNQGTKSEKWARMVCIIEKSQVHSELGNETPRTSVNGIIHVLPPSLLSIFSFL